MHHTQFGVVVHFSVVFGSPLCLLQCMASIVVSIGSLLLQSVLTRNPSLAPIKLRMH